MSKIFYKVAFCELNEAPEKGDLLEFVRETSLSFPLPLGTEVVITLEYSEGQINHHCEMFIVSCYEISLKGLGDEDFEEGDLFVVLRPAPGGDEDPEHYDGKVEDPKAFSELLLRFGWKRWR